MRSGSRHVTSLRPSRTIRIVLFGAEEMDFSGAAYALYIIWKRSDHRLASDLVLCVPVLVYARPEIRFAGDDDLADLSFVGFGSVRPKSLSAAPSGSCTE
jgi:hypothetical protein